MLRPMALFVTLGALACGCGPSALTPVGTAGSGQDPLVIATGVEVDNLSHRRTGEGARAEAKLYVLVGHRRNQRP